jgi:hypothetical protein
MSFGQPSPSLSVEQPSPRPPADTERLRRLMKIGANWFYWIAALSVFNTISILVKGGEATSFLAGLGVTMFVDATAWQAARIANDGAVVIQGIGVLIDVCILGLFAFLGWRANKARGWAFIVGMVLYVFDLVICLGLSQWAFAAFHAFALYGIWRGYSALGKMRAAASDMQATLSQPITPR